MSKKSFLISLAIIAGSILVINLVLAWTTPSTDPPGGNLPAPLNVGSTEQTKAGNLIIEGTLRLGQLATAPSGTEGALYFDTTEKKIKVYDGSAWSDLGGGWDGVLPNYTTTERDALSLTEGLLIYNTTEHQVQVYSQSAWKAVIAKLPLGATCTMDGDCDSTHCVDGVCCNTICAGNCDKCNVQGYEGTCTEVDSLCTGNCDVCTNGNCVADDTLCGTCEACSGSGTSYNCEAKTTNWGANEYSCTGGDTRCYNGSCITCGGSMNAGYCWYKGGWQENCNTVCNANGGVYNGTCNWENDPHDCSTCRQWFNTTSCGYDTHGPMYRNGVCFYHQYGANYCSVGLNGYRICACNE